MTRQDLLGQMKCAVLEVDPQATLILYGSRARNEASPDSDWDLLVLLSGKATVALTRAVRRRLYEIEWAGGEVISCMVRSREEWDRPRSRITPFHRRVSQEGVAL